MKKSVKKIFSTVLSDEVVAEFLFRMCTHDINTFRHMLHTCCYAAVVAEQCYEYKDTVNIAKGAALHDIGKLMIPERVLNKPGSLNEGELIMMRGHPLKGYELIKKRIDDAVIQDIIMHHHERISGIGYPDKICGNEVSEQVKIVSAADVFDAMTCERAYHEAFNPEEAFKNMRYELGGDYIDILEDYIKKEGPYK